MRLDIGAYDLEVGRCKHRVEYLGALVELVVAEGYDIEAHSVHQLDEWHAWLHSVVDVGVARNPVARVHDDDLTTRLIVVDYGCEVRYGIYRGVDVVGRDYVDVLAVGRSLAAAREECKSRYGRKN